MELEQRIQALEREVGILKSDVQSTLLSIRASLPEKKTHLPAWQKKAWALALVNVLLAVVLFSNIYLYLPGMPAEMDAWLVVWLRAFWIALAFVWLLAQMYPLLLLLAEDNAEWRAVGWRNAGAFLRARPGLMVLLTLVVFVISLVNAIFPAAWLFAALALLGASLGKGMQLLFHR
ncbi:MAG: hypothetical protein HY327_13325 [Chloroflexi bacterium]|nr:hypothetical protein [Chloroflexota bacterium]